ncbi:MULTISPECIES: DUF2304 domain-containing protein [Microbacterium]|uniref:DUF2304 domain-containing protein n=1 Tax=Microbacterium wangchenii TaxID=2541726 RepID=A0ABX5SSB7_9MICO|nr:MULTISPECIES: DUF2304 domain-containing protein [Microbacterium]MCK6066784.1 DUF2304 domain-containing protein [Microbacterium sp. EYE_512]QBR88101.1 DUF2304 domain-containing protein [Microbacterium wangchenii]TFV83779.1 DUF2304 domain-containing protein [Microbacterium sp. dk485]TXK18109.1 DUF2304 domain-containing protein [Microbacterium wangchenii]
MTVIGAVALALIILTIVMILLLRRSIREKYAVMWLVIGLAVLVLGLFPGLLTAATALLGVQLPANLLFTLAIVLLLGVSLHLSWELSRAEDEIRRVAEETAILRAEMDTLSAAVERLSVDRDAPDGDQETGQRTT